ncbi:MAG TPA: sugar transferase [Candidatus Saccharimonadales bacterium]|nr:sugar transferase [Candidatus Saccharimonadales bacterium]
MAHSRKKPPVTHALKRGIDLLGSLALLTLLLPVFIFVSVMVWFVDGGPVLYRRRVVGTGGEFDAFKFRTMKRGADALLLSDPALAREFERSYKLRRDPRVTRLGALLRRASVDELPQLFNVLMGQMSLVGPRMITAPELRKYGPYQQLLLTVKPGLTGYWQVHGRQNVTYEQRVAMDLHYIENWSLIMDLKILSVTPLRVLKREGAF